jgi:WD40 repeat protein
MSQDSKEIFISYAWGGNSEEFVNRLDCIFQGKGITIIRDKRDLGYKGLIKEFMEQIGRGKCVIAVINDKYLKSPNCMFELVQVAQNGHFCDRIFPVVLADAQIYDPVQRLKYIKHWEDKKKELNEAIKEVGAEYLQGVREEIDQYTEIRNTIAELTSILKNMNTLTPDLHSQSDFEILIKSIELKLSQSISETFGNNQTAPEQEGITPTSIANSANFSLSTTLPESKNQLFCLGVSPDSRLVAMGSDISSLPVFGDTSTVKIVDLSSGRQIHKLSGHSSAVFSVAFSPDNQILASASDDNTVKLWKVKTGQELCTLRGHSNKVRSVAFSPNGQLLASGSFDNKIKLWRLETGQELYTLPGHSQNCLYSIAFSPSGQILASGGDWEAKLWSLDAQKELFVLGGGRRVYSVAFSPDGNTLATGETSSDSNQSGSIRLWNVATGQLRLAIAESNDARSLSFSPDGQILASSSYTSVKLWDVRMGNLFFTLSTSLRDQVQGCLFSPDGRLFIFGGYTVQIWVSK